MSSKDSEKTFATESYALNLSAVSIAWTSFLLVPRRNDILENAFCCKGGN